MAKNDKDAMNRLDSFWNKVVRGEVAETGNLDETLTAGLRSHGLKSVANTDTDGLDEALAATVLQLHAADDAPAPDPAFSDRLWQKLMDQPAPVSETKKPGRKSLLHAFPLGSKGPWWTVARVAIAFSVVILVIAVAMVLRRESLEIPTVVAFEPEQASGVPIDTPITVRFNTQMDRASVESAFKVTPEVRGEFSWQGSTLTFTPSASLKRGAAYSVYIDNSAQSSQQRRLPASFEATFIAADNLSVLTVQPFKDSIEVTKDAVITVQFNNPVAPLTGLDASKIDPLVITPAVEGQGKWLTSAVYTFRPTNGLAASTQYTVTVRKGIADANGSALASDYTWSFRTWTPAVTSSFPANGAMFISTSPVVSVTFNQPIDRISLQQRFHLAGEDGREVVGSFSWSDDETVLFTPGRPLNRATRYAIKIDAGVPGANGKLGMEKEFGSNFLTIDVPRLSSVQPDTGSSIAAPWSIGLKFNQPMDRESVLSNLEFIPTPTKVYTNWSQSDTSLSISGVITQPSTHYRINFKAGAYDVFGQRMPEGRVIEYDTRPIPPTVSLRAPGARTGTLTASTSGPQIAAVQAINVDSASLSLYSLDKETFVNTEASAASPPNRRQQDPPGKLLRQWTLPAKGGLNETKVISVPLSLDGGAGLPSGLYRLETDIPEANVPPGRWIENRGFLVVSRATITLKATASEAIVWVADQVTGEPVRDSVVSIVDAFSKDTVASGKSDSNGLFFAKLPPPNVKGAVSNIYVFAEKDGDIAATSTAWSAGIAAYNYNLPFRGSGPDYAVALYTDRPIYRPGDKVYFKGVARTDDDGKFGLVSSDKPVAVALRDSQYRVVYSQTLTLDDFGSFDGELALAEEAPTGNYTIQASFDGNPSFPGRTKGIMETYSASFLVAEFRKPDFEVKVSTDKKEYIQGDEVAIAVGANYFFGAPLADAKVTWQVFQKPYEFKGLKDVVDGPFSFSDRDERTDLPAFNPGPRPIASGEGRTDASGVFTFRLRSDIAKETMGQNFTFEVMLTDANNQQVVGRSEATIHKGTFYIGVRPKPRVVAAGKPAGIDLITVDTRAITSPNKTVDLQLSEQKWYSVQEKGPDGRFYWTSKVENTLVSSAIATTGGDGKASTSMVPPRAGSYKMLAIARDERGNEVRSSTYVYASGSEMVYWRVENHDRIDLIADKPSYKPGETAKVLIPSPYPKAKALLTIERGHIMSYQTFDISSTSQVVEIPVESAHVPNVYVSIVLLRSEADGDGRADFKMGYVELPVQADEKRLRISITPEKAKYQPRDTATYKIKTTDYQGKPVQAELSVAMVDASVLSLAEEKVRDMFDSFYGRRSLSVRTAQTLSKALNKVDPELFGGGKGGGGDPRDSRGYFPDVAYWNPTVKTDRNGEATVSVTLPDTLTTWRLTARGTTVDTVVGTERNDIVVSKQVLVRPVVPRFLIVGDESRLEAIVHNYTQDTLEADVSLSAQGVAIDVQKSQRVKVAPSGTAKVFWSGKAGKDREARLTFGVEPVSPKGAPKDAVDVMLPVLAYSAPEVTATSGEVRTTITEAVQLPANIDRELGDLTIKMEPSLAAGMQSGLKYLDEFPFECVEQTISRFLPNIVTLRALEKVGIDNAELRNKLPNLVSRGIQRLYGAQNPDGSWGWWPGDPGDTYITAYALYGLTVAQREGFAVQPQVIGKAATYLSSYLANNRDIYSPEGPNLRAYILYVLAQAGKGERGTTVALYERRDSLGQYGRAYLAMALFDLNNGEADSRVKNLVEDLNSSAIASATGVHWSFGGKDSDRKLMGTNNRTTSVVLDALVRTDPTNLLIPGAVRWLMVSRGEGHWETTQETAMAIIGLTDYLAMSGEMNPNYSYELALNGKMIGGEKVTKANVNAQNILSIDVPSLLIAETNRIRMTRFPSQGEQTMAGKLYYSLYLRYFLPAQNIVAREEGIVVSREYLDVNDQPIKGTAVGNIAKVKLMIVAPQDLHYVALEDPLPAGAEAIDPALKTTSIASRAANKDRWRFNRVDIRDEKVAFFATFLPKGTYEYTYLIRATTAGAYQALPTTAYEMYFPEVWGRTNGSIFTIRPE